MSESAGGPPRLLTGAAWNAAGRGLPLLVAIGLTPFLVAALGLERWGLFTLALALVGVFGVFDFGVGAALTRAIAERLGTGREAECGPLAAAALVALLLISTGVAGGLWFAVPLLVEHGLAVPEALWAEATGALRVLVAAAPLVVVNAALWGVLAAFQRFRAANLSAIPVSILYYLGPLLVLLVWDSLVGVMLVLVGCRLLNTLAYAWLARPLLPGFSVRQVRLALVAPLLRLGGWMTLSGLLTQALIYADRFLIGALLTLTAVAYYATPLDLVLRAWIVPVAVAQALLPAMAGGFAARPAATAALLRRGALLIAVLVFPACLALAAIGPTLLGLWLGADFAAGGGTVLRILGVGVLFSCAGFAPNALLEAIGRPDAVARFSMLQAALFLPLLAAVLPLAGIEGAAALWAARAAVDAFGKLWLAAWLYPAATVAARRVAWPLAAGGVGLVAVAAAPSGGVVLLAGLALAAGAAVGWLALRALEPGDLRLRGA